MIRDLAVMLADGGDCLADLRAVGDQAALFGAVVSSLTAAWVAALITWKLVVHAPMPQ